MRPADRAWLAVDRYRRNHPIATDCAISFVALHLLRRWPPRLDPLAVLANLFGRT